MPTEMRQAAKVSTERRDRRKISTIEVRRLITHTEEILSSSDRPACQIVAVAAVVANPLARRYSEELAPLFDLGREIGNGLGKRLASRMGGVRLLAVGKAAVIGRGGELEHAVGFSGSTFDASVRGALALGRTSVPVSRQLGTEGTVVTVPFAPVNQDEAPTCRRAVDPPSLELRFAGSPRDDEALIVLAAIGCAAP